MVACTLPCMNKTTVARMRAQARRKHAASRGGMVVCMSCLRRFHEQWMIPAGSTCEFTGREFCDHCGALAQFDHSDDCPNFGK